VKLLLDTHILLWWLRGNPKLGAQTRRLIADPRAEPVVSIASFWEVSIKARTGKITEFGALLMAEATAAGFGILHVQPRHLAMLERLERVDGHNDPFDHLIVAQAKAENAVLITGDKQLRRYGVDCFPS
jgi:PIN domain nuclease of toxin-antitoxin system